MNITKQYRTPCMIKMLTWHLMFLCHLKSDVRTFLFSLAFFHKMQFSGHSITSKKRGQISIHSCLPIRKQHYKQNICAYVNVHRYFSYRFLSFTEVTGFLNRFYLGRLTYLVIVTPVESKQIICSGKDQGYVKNRISK